MIKGLSDRLRALRSQNNLTQKDVADRLGISASIVSAYEIGERAPSLDVLLALSFLYHCSTDYLLGKEKIAPKVVLDTDGLTDKQLHVLKDLIDVIKKSAE